MNMKKIASALIFSILIISLSILTYRSVNAVQSSSSHEEYNIYIYYDKRYPTSWFSRDDSIIMLRYLSKVFQIYNISYTIVNADELAEVISKPLFNNTIIIFTQDVIPYTVWNGSRNSLIIRWIRDGGIVIWTGDWEFYYVGFDNGTIKHSTGMENTLLSHQITEPMNTTVSPDNLASKYIPSLKPFRSYRPFSSSYIDHIYAEAYGEYIQKDIIYMDPALIKVNKGFFVKIGGTPAEELTGLDRGVYIAELTLNRFLGYNVSLTRGLEYFHPYDSGIVYTLPSNASSPYWQRKYGDRIYFYVYANLSNYINYIDNDFRVIKDRYKFIILIIPLEDTSLFYYNIRLMDSLASKYGLKILYGIFPKCKFGDEWDYLYNWTSANEVMKQDMRFFSELPSTMGVGIWYGWESRSPDPYEIRSFYLDLPEDIRYFYMVWLDQPFIASVTDSGLPNVVNPLNITVVTEMYDEYVIALYGDSYRRQIIVSGVWDAENTSVWREEIRSKISYLLPPSKDIIFRRLAIWIYSDVNDGFNEKYRAYINRELANPFFEDIPNNIYLSVEKRFYYRWLFDKDVKVILHFTWPCGYPASNLNIKINEKTYATDLNGNIILNITSHYPGLYIYYVRYAMWNTYVVEVYNSTPIIILILPFPVIVKYC